MLASMLRYLQRWEDPKTRAKYSQIVIIAHSQGTAIIVETLRSPNLKESGTIGTPGIQEGIPAAFHHGLPATPTLRVAISAYLRMGGRAAHPWNKQA